jgi:hypothetical protein
MESHFRFWNYWISRFILEEMQKKAKRLIKKLIFKILTELLQNGQNRVIFERG